MKTASIVSDFSYNDSKPDISVLMETENSKELRIAMKRGQTMKKHQTPFPIIVEIFEGSIDFGVEDQRLHLVKGDIISLEGGKPHDLTSLEDSIIRLSLAKSDKISRVENVVKD
ncbi:cupin [Lutimonas sp.]|uniref:cupin n=1 Tax=Lutimonas sp. TaxID=1872403 RepID=UPI003D9B64BB